MRAPCSPIEYRFDPNAPAPATLTDWADLLLPYAASRPSKREPHFLDDGTTMFVIGPGLTAQARDEGLVAHLRGRNTRLVVPDWAKSPQTLDLVGVNAGDHNLYLSAAPPRLATSTAMVVLYLHLRGMHSREEAETLLAEAHQLPPATLEVLLTLLQDNNTLQHDEWLPYTEALEVATRLG